MEEDEPIKPYFGTKRVLNEAERAKYLELYARGLSKDECVKHLRISTNALTLTRRMFPAFVEDINRIQVNRISSVEVEAFNGAMGSWSTVKTEYRATMKSDGTPALDKHGKPKMHLYSKVVTNHPPEWRAIEFILRARYAKKYGVVVNTNPNASAESLENMKNLLIGRVSEIADIAKEENIRN